MNIEALEESISDLAALPVDERIAALNRLMSTIGKVHPNQDPVSMVKWVPAEMVIANEYNPNSVMPPEMRALAESIRRFQFTQPIVTFWSDKLQKYVIVDGFHRNRVGKECSDVYKRIHGYLPIVVIDKSLEERIIATLLANEARGVHSTEKEAAIIGMLSDAGWSDTRIQEALRMKDADEILRLKQNEGIPSRFKNRSYSRSWILDPNRQKDNLSEKERQES